ncbi:MAG: hypothetical protein ACUVWO_16495 [Thermodesulfobacteriota bacterium]
MDVLKARNELRRMKRGDLFRMASGQRISKCLLGNRACGFHFKYKGFYFCVSEILQQGCVHEKTKEKRLKHEEFLSLLPSTNLLLNGFPLLRKKGTEFKVYCRDEANRSMILLGRIVERRMRERENNLRDLLTRATKDFSHRVPDPSLIFLLGP